MRRATSLFLLVCATALLGAQVSAQPPENPVETPAETHNKAFSSAQTFGPPPKFSLQDVTILLQREGGEAGHHRKVTLSGTGQTAYVQIKTGREFGEKAGAFPLNELLSTLQEAYRVGFFRMGSDYTTKLAVEEETPGEIATVYTEMRGRYPKVTLTIRIKGFEKTVTAVDAGDYAVRYHTPEGLLHLADFIENQTTVAAISKEIGK